MRAPLSWLREFAPIEGAVADLASTLSQLGLVVEGVDHVGEGLDQVVVARVLATSVHPAADRVQLVDVDPGDGSALRIVCGAYNFTAGDLVPLARPGTRLPGGFEIGRRKVRGQWSEGMLCSGSELGLSDDHSGILVLPPASQPGAPLSAALGIGVDVVFDLDVTPNRPDALSMAGVARDLAAKLKVPFALPAVPDLSGGHTPKATVALHSVDLCPRFVAVRLEGVTVGPSQAWLSTRLALAGMRPLNNVVDVSNYVMLELGQPNHPYDLDRLGGGGLSVRRGRPHEVVVTLDDVERAVGPEDCLICDAEDAVVGIGGIMGGASSEISDVTTTVLLESAWFTPMAIARTSKRLGLRTEASVRFERGVDPAGTLRAAARFCQLAGGVAGATVAGAPVDVGEAPPGPAPVTVRTGRVNTILGTSLTPAEVAGYLEPIGFSCESRDHGPERPSERGDGVGEFAVTVPSWRPDTEREIDVIEEVGRHHGYDRIPRTLPDTTAVGAGLTMYQRERRQVRQILVGAGLSEAWATSFLAPGDLERAGLAPDAVEVENPLATEESLLRTSLLPGLLRALVTNRSQRDTEVSLFEIGHVFLLPPAGADRPAEPERLAVVLAGRPATEATRLWTTLVDALGLEPIALNRAEPPGMHPTRSAELVAASAAVGVLGEVDPDVLAAHDLDGPVAWIDVDLGALLAAPRRPRMYRPVSRYPSADIDLAFVVADHVAAGTVNDALRAAGGEELEDVWLFDVFRGSQLGKGRRSLAFRLRFSALDHTLTVGELSALRARCIDAVESAFGARLRD